MMRRPTFMPRFAVICAAAGLVLAGLGGCGPSVKDAREGARAFCADHGGVRATHYYPSDFIVSAAYEVECKDGSTIE